MMKFYAIFAKKEEHDPTPYSSICGVDLGFYAVCTAEGVAQAVKEVHEEGFQSQVVRLPVDVLLGEDPVRVCYLEESLLSETYGHWE